MKHFTSFLTLLSLVLNVDARGRGGGGRRGGGIGGGGGENDNSNATTAEKILVFCIVCGFFIGLLLAYCIWWKCKCCKPREEEPYPVENNEK